MNDTVLLHLCNTMSKPVLLYASECVYNSRSDVLHVTKAWNQLFYKLFRVSEQDCINDIQMFFGIKSMMSCVGLVGKIDFLGA